MRQKRKRVDGGVGDGDDSVRDCIERLTKMNAEERKLITVPFWIVRRIVDCG